ncbi:MAG: DUF1768 domain-containing protein [Chloroflexi bacterium]|nr:DUF1768 domain-containing protein [Chloroflexota bacterium]
MTSMTRTYDPARCVVFRRTKDEFGALSNMAGGFPLLVNGIVIRSTEALYQCFRFPHRPDLQREIADQRSPMTAKMKSRRHLAHSRSDWNRVRIEAMRWCLRVKLAQHRSTFGMLLLETGERPIVELSHRDSFWGAVPRADGRLMGVNALGRLLAELRDESRSLTQGQDPLAGSPRVPGALLLGKPLGGITPTSSEETGATIQASLPLFEPDHSGAG